MHGGSLTTPTIAGTAAATQHRLYLAPNCGETFGLWALTTGSHGTSVSGLDSESIVIKVRNKFQSLTDTHHTGKHTQIPQQKSD